MKVEPIKDRVYTIIADNGKEFAALGLDYYFARLGAVILRRRPRRSRPGKGQAWHTGAHKRAEGGGVHHAAGGAGR